MSIKVFLAAIAIASIVASGVAFCVHNENSISQSTDPPSFAKLQSGAVITITSSDTKEVGGGEIVEGGFSTNGYYAVIYHLEVRNYSLIRGSWQSNGGSLVWLYGNGEVYMGTPLPEKTEGVLNQTMVPGNYTLIIGGHPGDRITITSSIQIENFTLVEATSFNIPAGTYISSIRTYTFYLNEPAELVGEFTTGGAFYYSLFSSPQGYGFSVGCSNNSEKPVSTQFSISLDAPFYQAGYYNLTFGSGTFYVNQTLEFIYFYP